MPFGTISGSANISTDFDETPVESHRSLGKHYTIYPSFPWAYAEVQKGRFAILESRSYTDFMVRRYYTDKTGHTDLHIMDECWNSLQLVTMALQKHSPLGPVLSKEVINMNEAGIMHKLVMDELAGRYIISPIGIYNI